MLSKEDREELAKLIAQNLISQQKKEDPYKGASKKEREQLEKQKASNERIEYLSKLKSKGKDTLAQRLELEKLNLLGKTPQALKSLGKGALNVAKVGATVAGGVATAAGSIASSTANSKLSKSTLQSILYSNPVTALLAENSDLLKGVGKGIGSIAKVGFKGLGATAGLLGKGLGWGANWLYQKTRKGRATGGDEESSASNLIEEKENMMSMGGTNYISTNKATFIGGKNLIMIGGNGLASGMFNQLDLMQQPNALIDAPKDNISGLIGTSKNKSGGFIGATNVPLLEDKRSKDKDVIEMTKGVDGIYKEAKKSNKFLEILGKKQVLIIGGLLLAVGAIFALAAAMKNLNLGRNLTNDNPSHYSGPGATSLNTSVLGEQEYKNYLMTNRPNFTGVSKTTVYKDQEVKDTNGKVQGYKTTYQFTTGNLTPIIAPITGYIWNFGLSTGSLNGGPLREYYSFTLSFDNPNIMGSLGGATVGALGGAATGAAAGALAGSAVPIIGTTAGAVIGGVTGAVSGSLGGSYAGANLNSRRSLKYDGIKFENVLNPKVANGMLVEKGQILGFADKSFKMSVMRHKKGGFNRYEKYIKNYQQQVNTAKANNWNDNIAITTRNLAKKSEHTGVTGYQAVYDDIYRVHANKDFIEGNKDIKQYAVSQVESLSDKYTQEYDRDIVTGGDITNPSQNTSPQNQTTNKAKHNQEQIQNKGNNTQPANRGGTATGYAASITETEGLFPETSSNITFGHENMSDIRAASGDIIGIKE